VLDKGLLMGDHLGKCITYASILNASSVIWIAAEFTEEHKKSLDFNLSLPYYCFVSKKQFPIISGE